MDFTPEEIKELHGMMQGTWQYIAYDYLQMNEGKSIPRSHVVEAVLDANYLETTYPKKPAQDLLKRFRKLDYKKQIKIANQTFTFKRYGL